MLCAITHLLSLSRGFWYHFFLILCMIDSLIAAVTTIYMRSSILEYLSLRVNTANKSRNKMIASLLEGYDLKITVFENHIISGTIKSIDQVNGLLVSGEIRCGEMIKIAGAVYRVSHASPINVNVQEIDDPEQAFDSDRTLVVYGHDITEESRAADVKEKIIKSRMDLCMSTAHDIRTPMFTVKFLSDTMLQCLSLSEEVRPYVEEIGINVDLLDMICSQMMDAGRLLSGDSMQPTLSSFDIRQTTNRMRVISKYINNNNLKLSFIVDDSVPLRIVSDCGWIFQIIMNYVTNALKYTHNGYMAFLIDYIGGSLMIKVTDSGIGIPDESKNDIFKTFVTLHKNIDTSKGVGLYSIATKVSTLGGTYGVGNNEPCGGSIFWCTIPAPKDGRPYSKDNRVRTILIVDDSPIVRKIIAAAISEHEVNTSHNGQEALREMIKREFDLVLMDVTMPVMSGVECVKEFRSLEKKLGRIKRQKIACISANSDNPGGIFDYHLGKPIDFKMLDSILSE